MSLKTSILRIFFALSFLFSAYTKFVAPGFFEITLMDQGIASSRVWAAHLTRFFIGLEFGLGLLLLFPIYTKKITGLALLLLSGFTVHLLYLWGIGDTENCGCFGEMISMTPAESILKNSILISIGVLLYLKAPKRKKGFLFLGTVFLVVILSQWFLLPIPKHSEMSFSDYTHFENEGRVDLSKGEKWIVVINLACEHCQQAAIEIGSLQRELGTSFPEIYALYYKEGDFSVEDFEALTKAKFPYHMIDLNVFFDLIGESPPRLYKLMDGKVSEFWDHGLGDALK
jgi:uncharacterized membrane protein YphA (DoxX/SURF4 family)